jgi:hypothetical protein
MGFSLLTILGVGVACAFGLWFVGYMALLIGARKAHSRFREKGFLKPPSGKDWFRFLLFKEYDYFNDERISFYFGISHFCLMALIIVALAIVVFVGCELLLGGVNGVPDGTFVKPTL